MKKTLFVSLLLVLVALGTFIYRLEFRPWWPPEGLNRNYHQLQRIPEEGEKFSFAVMGDNKNSFSTFRAILRDLDSKKEQLAFAIDVGDLVYDGEQEKYRVFYNQIKGVQLPFLVAVGNHDIREGGRAIYYELFGPFYYSFTVGNSYFIVLDDANMLRLEPPQMAWLRRELAKAQGYSHIFVFLHVPLRDPRENLSHSLLDDAQVKELLALFRDYHVTRVFASHIHGYFAGDWDGVPYTITGGAGAELMGTDPGHYFYHYMIVHVKGEQVTTSIVRFPSPPAELWDRLIHTAGLYIHSYLVTNGLNLAFIFLLLLLGYIAYRALRGRYEGKRG